MREDWKQYKIGEVADVTSSKRIFLSDYVPAGIPFYRSKEVIEKYNGNVISLELFILKEKYEVIKKKFGVPQKDDILLTSVGTIGVPYQVKQDEVFYFKDGNLTWIRKYKKEIDPSFLFQWIRSEIGQKTIQQNLIGSSQSALTIADIKKLKIQLPPLSTQKSIANILRSYDELIEVNNQRIKLLEETARELYKEWFVRMRFPGYKVVKFFKGVPDGWEVMKVGEVADVTSSKRIFLSDYVKEGVPFYRGKEISVKSNNETLTDLLYISPIKFREIKKKFGAPKSGDILITAVGTLGNIYLVNDSDGDFYFKDGNLIWLRNFESKELSLFFYYYSISDLFRNSLSSITIGSSQEALTIASLKKILMFLPAKDLIIKFFQIADPIKNLIDILQQQNTSLRQIRDRLLPRLISGKLEVKSNDINTHKI